MWKSLAVIVVIFSIIIHVYYPWFFLRLPNETEASFGERVRVASIEPMHRFSKIVAPFLKQMIRLMGFIFKTNLEGTIMVPGVKEEVEVLTDAYGVPHIYAQNEDDLYFAQGFIHAHERLWQMELNRHITDGRLSELIGPGALQSDVLLRSLGFARKKSLTMDISPEAKKILQSYVDGINAFIVHAESRFPLEFTIFGLSPKNWTVGDILGYSYLFSWQMSAGWIQEIAHAAMLEKAGAFFEELEILYPATASILTTPYEYGIINTDGTWKPSVSPFLRKIKGSNAWTIDGKLTESGNSILCNDPHLPLMAPSFWYENHLEVNDKNKLFGVSVPGVPGILIGHNEHIAWGITLAFSDVADLVIEKINSENQYEYNGEWKNMQIIQENFVVKGEEKPRKIDLKYTRNGPLISEALDFNKPTSYRATSSDCTTISTWNKVNKAQNWEAFSEAMMEICFPLSIVYADVQGNTGYWATGSVPIRKPGFFGDLPIPGWTDEGDWLGIVPPHELPHAFNPEKGYVVTANNRIIVPENYPYFLGNAWVSGYRASRIEEFISTKKFLQEPISVQELQSLQVDVKSLAALELIDALKPFSEKVAAQLIGKTAEAWAELLQFSGKMAQNDSSASILSVTWIFLLRNIVEPVLGENLTNSFLGAGPSALFDENEFQSYDIVTLIRLLKNESSWWIANAGGHVHVITKSIHESTKWLQRELGNDISEWNYGKIHQVTFHHAFSDAPILGDIFNVGPYPLGGDTHTVMLAAINPVAPFNVGGWATHWRYCVDMGNLKGTGSINAPGQSGNIANQHYDDLMPLWLSGKYKPTYWNRDDLLQNKHIKLTINAK